MSGFVDDYLSKYMVAFCQHGLRLSMVVLRLRADRFRGRKVAPHGGNSL